MKLKSLLSVCFSFLVLTLFGQQGTLVVSSGDTLKGKIEILIPERFNERVTIKSPEGPRTFNSSNIIEVSVDGDRYRSILYNGKYRIMKEIQPGYLGWYQFRIEEAHDFGQDFLYKITDEGLEVPNIAFRGPTGKFLEECPVLNSGMKQKQYKRNDLAKIVSDYNTLCLKKLQTQSIKVASTDFPVMVEELNELVFDIQKRMESNLDIPSYMLDALKSYSKKDVNAELDAYIKLLEKD